MQNSLVTLKIYVEFERNLLLVSFADAVPSGGHSCKDRNLNAIRVALRHKFQISC